MVDKVVEGTWAEAFVIGIPALTIVITLFVRIGLCVVNKVKQVGWGKDLVKVVCSFQYVRIGC